MRRTEPKQTDGWAKASGGEWISNQQEHTLADTLPDLSIPDMQKWLAENSSLTHLQAGDVMDEITTMDQITLARAIEVYGRKCFEAGKAATS